MSANILTRYAHLRARNRHCFTYLCFRLMVTSDRVNGISTAPDESIPKMESTVALDADDMVDVDMSRIIERAYRESATIGTTYDIATGAAIRAIMSVYPNLSRDEAFDQVLRLRVPPY